MKPTPKTRRVLAGLVMLACLGGHVASAADALGINFQGHEATPRITYATGQVKAACPQGSYVILGVVPAEAELN